MANNPKYSFQATIAIVVIIAICVAVIVFEPAILPLILKPTPTAIQPTSSLSSHYQPEIIPAPTNTPDPVPTSTLTPTDTPTPTFTPTPTYTPINKPLPDLTVTGISDPVCTPGHIDTTTGVYVKFTIIVRNTGRVSTRSFGPFNVGIFLILGQNHYGLDEWATKFNGVVGSSNLRISNLNPGKDIELAFEIDLKGNTNFGIQAIANSGDNPIPESDTNNNTLIKYFSIYCY